MKRKSIIIGALVAIALTFLIIFGGTYIYAKLNPNVKISGGLSDDIVFRIDDLVCTKEEFNVLLYDKKKQYDELYGSEIWDKQLLDLPASQFLKNEVLNQMAIYKCVRLLAEEKKVYLNDAQKEEAKKLAKKYMAEYSESQIEKLGISQKALVSIFEEKMLYDKLYDSLTTSVNEEISVDEARVIKIQYIYVSADLPDAKNTINSLNESVIAGDSFEKLAQDNNKDTGYECLLARGDVEEAFEDVAFELSADEVSGIVSTTKGYYIIKCINDYEKAATESNKQTILNERKNAIFGEIYDKYVSEQYYELNEKMFEKYEFDKDFEVKISLSEIEE